MVKVNIKEIVENLISTFLYAGKVSLGLRDKGFQIKTHKGKDGGQEVFHFHLHLLSNA